MNKFCLTALLVASTSVASDALAKAPKFEYLKEQNQLLVDTQQCLYGRGVESSLKQLTFKKLSEFIHRNEQQISDSLASKHKLTSKQKSYLSILMKAKLGSEDLDLQFSFVGNDTCTEARAKLKVDPKFDFSVLFDFDLPAKWHFTSSTNHALSVVKQRLNDNNVSVDDKLVAQHLTQTATYSHLGKEKAYYTFDFNNYLQSNAETMNTVFIEGNDEFSKALHGYLLSKNFKVVPISSKAFWRMKLIGSIEANNFLNLKLDVSNIKDKNFQLVNNSRKLPAADMSQTAQLEKFTKVHLELMKLTEQLK